MFAITLEFAVAICFLIDEKGNVSIRNGVYLHIDFAVSPDDMLIWSLKFVWFQVRKGIPGRRNEMDIAMDIWQPSISLQEN